MAITSTLSPDEGVLTLYIEGRFDFGAHQEFRASYEQLKQPPSRYRVDMRETNYLDSSALGMLLLLRDYAGGDDARIEIVNTTPEVRKILTISNFDQLFDIK